MSLQEADWEKILEEAKKHTQKTANQLFLNRKDQIIKELSHILNKEITVNAPVKKGRPRTLPSNP